MILIGKRIKELRNKYKLTQTELAQKVGVTKSTIAAYENDSRQPSYEVLIKMSNTFKVSIDSLLLNRSSTILEIDGLKKEQLDVLDQIIKCFRTNNSIENYLSETTPDFLKTLKNHTDTQNHNKLSDKHYDIFEE